MLSKEALWCLNVSFRNGRKFCTTPFVWDKVTRTVTVPPRNLFIWKCIASILFAYAIFAFVRLIQSYFILALPLQKCIIQVYFVISSFYFATAHLSYWSNHNDFASFWTKFLQFDQTYSGENFNGSLEGRAGLFLKCLTFLNYSHALFQGAGFLFIRKNPNFLYSLVWEIWGVDYISLRILFALFEMLIMLYSWGGCQLINAGIILFPNSVQKWNTYVTDNTSKVWKQKKVQYYRTLQLLVSNFSSSHSPIALPAQEFAVLFGGIICTYATIKFYGEVPLFIYLTMPTSVVIMMFYEKIFHGGSASITLSSETLLQDYELALLKDAQQIGYYNNCVSSGVSSMLPEGGSVAMMSLGKEQQQQQHDNDEKEKGNDNQFRSIKKLQKSYWASFNPLGISVFYFYTIKRGTVMTFGSLVLGNAINLLLA